MTMDEAAAEWTPVELTDEEAIRVLERHGNGTWFSNRLAIKHQASNPDGPAEGYRAAILAVVAERLSVEAAWEQTVKVIEEAHAKKEEERRVNISVYTGSAPSDRAIRTAVQKALASPIGNANAAAKVPVESVTLTCAPRFKQGCGRVVAGPIENLHEAGWRGNPIRAVCPECRDKFAAEAQAPEPPPPRRPPCSHCKGSGQEPPEEEWRGFAR